VATTVLERDDELASMGEAVSRAALGRGGVVLLHGEAGIGKSTLVAALRARLPEDARLLVGHCDDLATPRPLGPLRDIAPTAGAELARALRDGTDRDALFQALHDELTWPGHATVLVVEDVHWADHATLDTLRFLVRRVADLPALLLLTYRDDLAREHPLHPLLALCHASPTVTDLAPAPLSEAAVRTLAGNARPDVATVHAVTGGNPFFVHEALAATDSGRVPTSVVESVLARLGRLKPSSRDSVEQLSVLTAPADRRLVEALVAGGIGSLVEAEEQGLLAIAPDRVGFRHELTRRAVLDALPTARRAGLNTVALAALESAQDLPDPAQLVHHAVEAGDIAGVVRLGPEAASVAASRGSHREAAAHYRVVLAHRDAFTAERQAELLQASAIECYAVGDHGRSSLPDQQESVRLRRALPDPVALGNALRWLSRIAWWSGNRSLADEAGAEAVAVLSACADKQELALAHSNLSQLAMLAARREQAVEQAELAIALAREVHDDGVLTHAMNNLGTALWAVGDPRGRPMLQEALDLALETHQHEHATRAYCNLVWQLCANHELADAAVLVERGIAHAERAEHVVFWKYLHVEKAMIKLALGEWDEAERLAANGLDATDPVRSSAVTVIATVQVRRGEATDLVDEAWQLATRLDELQRTGPAAVLVCENAWLRDDEETIRRIGSEVHSEAIRLHSPAWTASLGFWLGRVGVHVDVLTTDSPYALMGRGEWRAAASAWANRGYPYETALALSLSDEPAALIDALARLDALGAGPLARRVRRELRDRGVAGVPRGPRPETRRNLAGLTARQLEVLDLVADGLTNADIASRLVLSVRTVDRHVTAVLEKLGARSRTDAVVMAHDQGWVSRSG
jgi:DNA-binding CsgD family transcriptional regulator/tetratricopeptide (TPR) repeat protein